MKIACTSRFQGRMGMRIGAKVGIGFGAVLVLTGVTGFVGFSALQTYADGVAVLDQTNTVSTDFAAAYELVGEFQASRDPAKGELAAQDLARVTGREEALSESSDDSETRAAFREAFDASAEFGAVLQQSIDLARETNRLFAETHDAVIEIVRLSETVNTEATALAEAANLRLAEAEEIMSERLSANEFAVALIRQSLLARQSETAYRVSWSDDDLEATKAFTKDMFLTALKMKKSVKGTSEETIAHKIATAVSVYRKSFDALVQAFMEAKNPDEPRAALAKASRNIKVFTEALEKRHSRAIDAAISDAEASRGEMARMRNLQSEVATLTIALKEVEIGEKALIANENGARAQISAGLAGILDHAGAARPHAAGTEAEGVLAEIETQTVALQELLERSADTLAKMLAAESRIDSTRRTASGAFEQVREQVEQSLADAQATSTFAIAVAAVAALALGYRDCRFHGPPYRNRPAPHDRSHAGAEPGRSGG